MPIIDMTFTCPKCGSNNFGSTLSDDPTGPMERYCHGFIDKQRCSFKFRDRDDWRYFQANNVRPFRDQDEYKLVMDIIRSVPAKGMDWDAPGSHVF